MSMNQQQENTPRQEASGGITPTKRPPLAPADAVVLTELRWVVFETCSSTALSYPVWIVSWVITIINPYKLFDISPPK